MNGVLGDWKKDLAEGIAKGVADPKKLPTAKLGDKWICQWEQLGVPCPSEPDHFGRNAHKVCCFCYAVGHPLARCPVAAKEGVPVAALLAEAPPPAAAGPGGGRGRALRAEQEMAAAARRRDGGRR